MKSLQEQFCDSRGKPIEISGSRVIQVDRVPLGRGFLKIHFLSSVGDLRQGITLKAKGGFIELSYGEKAERVNIWHESNLPDQIEHRISCPSGELLIWNIYHIGGQVPRDRADYWTNNAGMVVQSTEARKRIYHCSNGLGEFSPDDLVLSIEWSEQS